MFSTLPRPVGYVGKGQNTWSEMSGALMEGGPLLEEGLLLDHLRYIVHVRKKWKLSLFSTYIIMKHGSGVCHLDHELTL